jgi:ferritin-like protein
MVKNSEALTQALARIRQMRKQAAAPEEAVAPMPQFTPEQQAMIEAQQAQQDAAPIQGEGVDTAAEATGEDGMIFEMLVGAYCAEICAAWQYERARIAALGKARNYLVSECEEHRDEELDHAEKLADLLDSFGGEVPFSLSEIEQLNPTPAPPQTDNNRDTAILAHQLLEAEQGAIDLYTKIEQATRDGGPEATMINNLVVDILTTEQKHAADMIKVGYAIQG